MSESRHGTESRGERDGETISSRYTAFVGFTFAAVVAGSFTNYSEVLFDPLARPFAFLALLNLYVLVLLSWAGYSQSVGKYPYTDDALSVVRLGADFLVVVVYAFLLRTIGSFGQTRPVEAFVFGYVLVFLAYIASGRLRVMEYDRRASKQNPLECTVCAYGLLYLGYVLVTTLLTLSPVVAAAVDVVTLALTLVLYLAWRYRRDIGGELGSNFADSLWVPSACASPGTLTVVTGLPGVGKTTVAGGLAAQRDAAHLQTDRTRKDLFGDPDYTDEETRATYAAVLSEARARLGHGEDVVLDGTFKHRGYRAYAAELAAEAGGSFDLVAVECDADVVRRRLEERVDGASDADVAVYERMREEFDPVETEHRVVDNSERLAETRRVVESLA